MRQRCIGELGYSAGSAVEEELKCDYASTTHHHHPHHSPQHCPTHHCSHRSTCTTVTHYAVIWPHTNVVLAVFLWQGSFAVASLIFVRQIVNDFIERRVTYTFPLMGTENRLMFILPVLHLLCLFTNSSSQGGIDQ